MHYWEDLSVGERHRFGSYELTHEEVAAFAEHFFTPPAVAGADANAVPGYFLCCVAMRLWVDNMLASAASLGSPGVDRVDWPSPAHVGDVVSLATELLAARVLKSRPEMGLVKHKAVLVNQADEPVTRLWTNVLVARREVAP
jgi:acyl dehydratase